MEFFCQILFVIVFGKNISRNIIRIRYKFFDNCNQCNYASFQAGYSRKHLNVWLCIFSGRSSEDPFENTWWKKSYKFNQCNYASFQAVDLRKHLEKHSGEKSNKCNQCDFASSRAGHLRTHFKTHTGDKSKNATNVIMQTLRPAIWGNIWKSTAEKSQIQPVWICPLLGKQFGDTFENKHQRKVKMQSRII